MSRYETTGPERLAWVDTAKGFCIVMVVMMHSTLGVGEAMGGEGFLHDVVAFARPFRMPDFFMISGLFLARVIDRGWRDYLDRKVLHFGYFYLLWLVIQGAFKWPALAAAEGPAAVAHAFALALVEPFGTLWFIYLLPIFFVAAKLLRRLPPALVLAAAAGLQILGLHTGWTVPDEFAARFVYFLVGYYAAPVIFRAAAGIAARPALALAGLSAWALVNGSAVAAGIATLPGVSLALGLAGAAAVVAGSVLATRAGLAAPLQYAGERSIVVYLAFFLPMAATRALLVKTGVIEDVGVVALAVTAAGVLAPLMLNALIETTVLFRPLSFLFKRPRAMRLAPAAARLQPAE